MPEAIHKMQKIAHYGNALHFIGGLPTASGICEGVNLPHRDFTDWDTVQAPEWEDKQEEQFSALLEKVSTYFVEQGSVAEIASRLSALETLHRSDFTLLHNRIAALESLQEKANPLATVINTLGIEGIEVKKPIPVTIEQYGDSFVAHFYDANISAGGDTVPRAIGSLQNLIADAFEDLESEPDEKLGKSMKKQKRILQEMLCRTL